MIDGHCAKHAFEAAEAACRQCGMAFCNECLVYSFGPNKPPYCVPCALAAAGVRANTGRPAVSKKAMRKLEKERRKAEKRAKKMGAEPVIEVDDDPVEPEPANPFAWADEQDAGERVPF